MYDANILSLKPYCLSTSTSPYYAPHMRISVGEQQHSIINTELIIITEILIDAGRNNDIHWLSNAEYTTDAQL